MRFSRGRALAAAAGGAALAVSAGLAGCAGHSPPRLTLAGAGTGERSDQGVVLLFTLDAENENDHPLPLKSVRYSVYVGGERVFSGFRSPEATLRRFGTQQIVLPAAVADASRLPAGPADYRVEGVLTYLTPGALAEALFDQGVRRPRVRFRGGGTIDLGTPATP